MRRICSLIPIISGPLPVRIVVVSNTFPSVEVKEVAHIFESSEQYERLDRLVFIEVDGFGDSADFSHDLIKLYVLLYSEEVQLARSHASEYLLDGLGIRQFLRSGSSSFPSKVLLLNASATYVYFSGFYHGAIFRSLWVLTFCSVISMVVLTAQCRRKFSLVNCWIGEGF